MDVELPVGPLGGLDAVLGGAGLELDAEGVAAGQSDDVALLVGRPGITEGRGWVSRRWDKIEVRLGWPMLFLGWVR